MTNINPYAGIVSEFGIDVNGTAIEQALSLWQYDTSDSALCDGCSMPLYNLIGAFAIDSSLAATFAIHALTVFLGAVFAWYSYRIPSRQTRSHGADLNVFSLRTGLMLFVVSRLLKAIYIAVPNSITLHREYFYFSLVLLAFTRAAETTLIWTLLRTVCQSMVVANGYTHSRAVGLGLTLTYALFALAQWLVQVMYMREYVDRRTVEGVLRANPIASMIVYAWSLVVAIVIFALAIHGLRRTRTTLDPIYRVVNKTMVWTGLLCFLRSGLSLYVGVFPIGLEPSANTQRTLISIIPLIQAVIDDILGLCIFALLFVCYRPHLLLLYSSSGSYIHPEADYKPQQRRHNSESRQSHYEPHRDSSMTAVTNLEDLDMRDYRKSGMATVYSSAERMC